MNDPTREELEELAACGIVLARSFLRGKDKDAETFAITICALVGDLFEGPIPGWLKAARPRIEGKLDAFKKRKKGDGKAGAA